MKHKYKEEVLVNPVEKNENNFVAIVIDVSSVMKEKRVIYHNADSEVGNFKDFVEYVLNEFSVEEVKLDNEKFVETFLENGIIEVKDFDEETRREWNTYDVEGVLVQCFNGFDWNTLDEKITNAEESFKEYEKNILDDHLDAESERKDPYAYRGVHRSDFF